MFVPIAMCASLMLAPPSDPDSIVTQITPQYADMLTECEYGYVQETPEMLMLDGVQVHPQGVYWFPVGGEIVTDRGSWSVPPMSVIGVLTGGVGSGSVTVECASGWYACCFCQEHNGRLKPVARCRRQTCGDSDCQAGGAGSTSCSIGQDNCTEH